MPACFGASGSVRARQRPQSAVWADDVHTFWPSITHSSPSRTARVLSDARSEPEPGSLKSWHHDSSPRSIGSRNRFFCSSVPWAMSVGPAMSMPTMKKLACTSKWRSSSDTTPGLDAGASLAAVLHRPVRRRPAGLELGALPRLGRVELGGVVLVGLGPERLPAAVALAAALGHRLEPRPRLGPDRGLGRGVVDVHD